ncbi:PAS domain-containing sensor histidine kinase [Meiothermus sp. QL-1]|uniref:sensor histidine kinase n=1 Tax=Meiothermus sp. QL-1 TaxID=2058095 RepID=UPI001F3F2804|nr:PAS domain-containing sensor histidine kinase [Meiothermus sp. QL-1]
MSQSPLEQRDWHLRSILEAIPDDLMLVDQEGHIREYKAGKSPHHLPMDRFLGSTLAELLAEQAEALMEVVRRRLPPEQAPVVQVALEEREFEVRVVPMNEGMALLLFRDITAERQAERLKAEFLAAVSHELKTPLATILGFSELLLYHRHTPEEAREFLENIHHSSLRLRDMVNNLLDTSRLEAGHFSLSCQPTDLHVVLLQTARSFSGVARLGQIDFRWELEPLPILEVDPERVAQVVGNLLSNAFKFCPRGGTIWLRARAHSGVLIEVEDTGPGIPLEEQGQLFRRFGRTPSAVARGVAGTGLGLYISRAIVEAHHGRIWLESEEGRGAKFSVWLPL